MCTQTCRIALLTVSTAALLLACHDMPTKPVPPPRPDDGFSVERLLSDEFLVVRITVSEDGIETGAVRLARGPTKTNSPRADLVVIPSSGEEVIGAYTMPDPRFQRFEGAGWHAVESADTFVFVPLSADIDLVTIRPVRGREAVVSKGDKFDPRPLAVKACSETNPPYPGCRAILARLRLEMLAPD